MRNTEERREGARGVAGGQRKSRKNGVESEKTCKRARIVNSERGMTKRRREGEVKREGGVAGGVDAIIVKIARPYLLSSSSSCNSLPRGVLQS